MMMIISGWWWWGGGGWWWRRRWWWWLFCQMVCPRNLLAAHMRQGVEDQQVIREAPAWAKNHWRWEDHEWQGLSGQRRDRRWQISPGRHFGHHDGVDRRFKSHAAKSPGHQKVGRKRCLSLKLVFFAVGVVVCSMLVISLNFCWLRFDSIMIQWQRLALQPASVEQVCEECRWSLDEDLDSPFLFYQTVATWWSISRYPYCGYCAMWLCSAICLFVLPFHMFNEGHWKCTTTSLQAVQSVTDCQCQEDEAHDEGSSEVEWRAMIPECRPRLRCWMGSGSMQNRYECDL